VAQGGQRSPILWRVFSALLLLTMGGIHLYLVLTGFGGVLGMLFVLNAIGGLVLAIAIMAAPRRFLPLVSVLGLLFIAGTLLALVLALTVGLFGIREQLGTELVPTTLIVESIDTIVLAVTTELAFRMRRSRCAQVGGRRVGPSGARDNGGTQDSERPAAFCPLEQLLDQPGVLRDQHAAGHTLNQPSSYQQVRAWRRRDCCYPQCRAGQVCAANDAPSCN
jgi:hypothetical protein